MGKDRWRELFHPGNGKLRQNVFLILLLGVLFLTMGQVLSPADEKKNTEPQAENSGMSAEKGRETERRMSEFLSCIEGAGQVDVMLTYRQTEEKTIAGNEIREESGDSMRTEQTVVLLEDEKGATHPLVLTESAPTVEGVVIAAQGADSPAVAAALNQAAQALLDLPAHKVAVLKMK